LILIDVRFTFDVLRFILILIPEYLAYSVPQGTPKGDPAKEVTDKSVLVKNYENGGEELLYGRI